MANSREIQSRIKSIQSTMKITNAMYMVSSSKLQKARRDLNNTIPFFDAIQQSLARILDIAPEAGETFFESQKKKSESQIRRGFLVITADKGLAGAYNHNVIKEAEEHGIEQENNMLFIVGQVGRHYFRRKKINVDIDFKYTAQNPTTNRARHIASRLTTLYDEGKLDEVYVIYTKVINSMVVEPQFRRLLPLKAGSLDFDNNLNENSESGKANRYEDAEFVPDAKTVFRHIIPDFIAGFIFGALTESYCAEHNARMLAMQTATNAATDMLKDLNTQYNRARQGAITQEITEVVAGAKAQKKDERL